MDGKRVSKLTSPFGIEDAGSGILLITGAGDVVLRVPNVVENWPDGEDEERGF